MRSICIKDAFPKDVKYSQTAMHNDENIAREFRECVSIAMGVFLFECKFAEYFNAFSRPSGNIKLPPCFSRFSGNLK